ncbi:hypothetical protein DMUE_3624, partial [Dictyocoela muelleri]
ILLSLPNSLQKNFKSFCEDKTDKSSEFLNFLRQMHLKLIHPGNNKMYLTLKKYVSIPNLKQLCNEITSKCETCFKEKNYQRKTIFPDYKFQTKGVNDVVSLDLKDQYLQGTLRFIIRKKILYISND